MANPVLTQRPPIYAAQMSMPVHAPEPTPCGSWKSPLTAQRLVSQALRLGTGHIGADGSVYWLEGRPSEGGRTVLARWRPGEPVIDLTPAPHNVRTTVQEYGGGAFTEDGGDIWFVDHPGQRLLHRAPDGYIRALTREGNEWRLADLVVDRHRQRLLAVGERKSLTGGQPENALVAVPLAGGDVEILVSGADFYSSPRLSPDGRRLAWLTWNHPHMPWDAAALFLAFLDDDGRPHAAKHVAGGADSSVVAPGFMANGDLLFMFEPKGHWNPFILASGAETPRPLLEMAAEFALPQWQFNMSTWQPIAHDRIACAFVKDATWSVLLLDTNTGAQQTVTTPLLAISDLRARDGRILITGAGIDTPASLLLLDTRGGKPVVLQRSSVLDDDWRPFLSHPTPITFPTGDGETAHAVFYAPSNPDFVPRLGERPPLIVTAHGGPTAATGLGLNLNLQFWTSRGFAVLDVNYRGSTGYGRRYRDRLKGAWGLVDVEDCVAGARFLAETGHVDPQRMAIRGSSAGGYTALAALTFHDAFRAGASLYGIGDLAALARDTHKFESHYTDALVAPYPARADIYRARSPLFAAERITAPIIFFQGEDDPVVPASQAEAMVAALADRGIPCAYLPFPGEQHGFRRAETLQRVLEAELYFYGRVFGFTPADVLTPLSIRNLP